MKITLEVDANNPINSTIVFDGVKQSRITRLDLKLKTSGLCYLTVERSSVVDINGKKQVKKTKEQIFKVDYNPPPNE